ncbi:hypothetical protein BCD64_13930 [Nostoc sp. MBR 210]|nr:hypothetical protein BCD64_13930 [Nostoc sp. MBR 210]
MAIFSTVVFLVGVGFKIYGVPRSGNLSHAKAQRRRERREEESYEFTIAILKADNSPRNFAFTSASLCVYMLIIYSSFS